MAAGRWVLKKAYVEDSSEGGQFRNPKSYVHDECVITHRKNWKRFENNKKQLMGGIFYNMKALFVMDDIEAKERYQRIVYAGGGDWMNDSLYGARKKRVDGRSLTHIIIDPWVLDKQEGRHRYYDFEDWLDYEKSVASKSSDTRDCQRWQNGGVVFKLHFTFLIDSLLKPNDNIKWKDYNIFDQRVQDLALKRRFICEEEVRLEATAGVKRKAASDTAMVHHLGYMESTKRKNKRSAGSHIQADATRHIMQNGIVDTNKLFEDHGCAQLESLQADYIRNLNRNIQSVMNSHPLSNRPKTFTDDKEEIVLDDSDIEIVEDSDIEIVEEF